ncbi:PRC and DUF2382 domain-containing protein [Nocardioides sp. zg-1308]|uniref:PRC and DUF2382 domain-containing protein n=1 Tax=Nocardioides renjunii TaxID=3095075 RepID=A0ABU5KFH9_9ACTN|nr:MULTISPECIES: PRC and DUF2382 domain-containing protein [unclassified Nocardioides]MDZ5663721.1 PRC and DUF2382 domain-containing protein [Nocardioides sp. S-58]NPD06850.1 PRC and DUF2382 domain-containing protein [Nocardioides sp. zg-1308]WQQ20804.1 PRC and DUF2382 domain-containing protein [Nocardioides sp. S-34]
MHENEIQSVIGKNAYDSNGDKIGSIGHIFLDDETGQPEFASVNTGLFGMKETFVPITNATVEGDRLVVPFTKDQVKDAPNVDVDGGHLDQAEERRLYEHYNMSYSEYSSDSGLPEGGTGYAAGTAGTADYDTSRTDHTVGHDTSGPTTDEAMTRSEERLDVGTSREEAGRVRLRKYVTTEQETVSVPVKKERAVLETEPITEANRDEALSGPAISEEEHEVVLQEEHAVVGKTAEPVERVRLGKETVTDEETVTEEVRKEHIETEGDLDDRRGTI